VRVRAVRAESGAGPGLGASSVAAVDGVRAVKLLEVERNALGCRVRVCAFRVHHGLVGVALVAVGAFLIGRDLDDFPWLRDW
jgi:hypothetical protein